MPHPVWVVLPMQGEPSTALDAVTSLMESWPEDVDAELLVPTRPLTASDGVLRAALGEAVLPSHGTFGELVLHAVTRLQPDDGVVVVDEQHPEGPHRSLLAGQLQDNPVIRHALDHRALLSLLSPVPAPAGAAAPLTGPPTVPGLLSAVVVTRGNVGSLKACLDHLTRGGPRRLEVVVVNNGTQLDVTSWLAARRDLVVLRQAGSLDEARNAGLVRCTGEQVLVLDGDVVLPRHWSQSLALHGDHVAVGPVAHGLPGSQHDTAARYADLAAFHAVASTRRSAHRTTTVPTTELASSPLLARTADLRAVGGFHRDTSLRLRARGQLAIALGALVHVEVGPSRGCWPLTSGAPLLSAALIVKDEQAALPACLASLRGVVDEVVVCDTGSSDATVEIARAMGATVLSTSWDDDFSAARNTALAATRGTWVLSIDADEQLHVDDVGLLRHALALSSDDALRLPITSRAQRSDTVGYEHQAPRLLRREAVEWVGAVHEAPVRKGSAAWIETPPMPGIRLVHDGYLEEVKAERGKVARNLLLAEKDLARSPAGDPRRWKAAYELARSLGVTGDTAARVLELTTECLALDPPDHFRTGALVLQSGALVALCRFAEAEAAARATGADDAPTALALAAVLEVTGRAEDAVQVLEACACDGTDPVKEGMVRAALVRLRPAPVERARGLLEAGEVEAAALALQGIDVDGLTADDLLVAVAVAGTAGDRETAEWLLARAGPLPPALEAHALDLACALGLSLPGRVVPAPSSA